LLTWIPAGFAWTGEYNSVHWIVPTIAGIFLATSILLIFVAYLNYLTDSYLMFAASAIAANTVCRSAAGAAAPLFTQYMFDALGVGGGGSLIGGVAILLAPIPVIFYKYGEPIRKRSKFAPTAEKPADVEQEASRERSPGSDSSSVSSSHASSSEITNTERIGINGVARPDDTREVNVAQAEKPRGDPERDLEKGES
jgi:MFS transporter, DHA1 family, multidrug resistance protein